MRTISQIRTLINAGVGTNISAGELMSYNVQPDTALKLVYIPVVTSRAAFEYADVVCQICARKRLNYKEQTRTLKQEMKEYERETMGIVGHEIEEDLKDKVDFFFDEAYSHIEKLQQSVHAEMKKQWPDLTDYTLLLNLSIRGIMGYVYHGDVLEGTVKQKYILLNPTDDTLAFSDIVKSGTNDMIVKEK